MSGKDWEFGEITIPRKEYIPLRKAIIEAFNQNQLRMLRIARNVYDRLIQEGKGKRKFNYLEAFTKGDDNTCAFGMIRDYVEEYWFVKDLLFPDHMISESSEKAQGLKPKLPKKSQIKILSPKMRRIPLQDNYGHIGFDDDRRMLIWSVPEDNSAVENARSTVVAQVLFKKLEKIQWTRGSGGQITGNDEYRRESKGAGMGGNYVVNAYGA